MTERQEYMMEKIREKLNDLRLLFDDMLHRTKLSHEEYMKFNEIKDELREINDRLF